MLGKDTPRRSDRVEPLDEHSTQSRPSEPPGPLTAATSTVKLTVGVSHHG
jgi:hypothetical protein